MKYENIEEVKKLSRRIDDYKSELEKLKSIKSISSSHTPRITFEAMCSSYTSKLDFKIYLSEKELKFHIQTRINELQGLIHHSLTKLERL